MSDVPFQLVETMRWRPDEGYWLLDRHLTRLFGSARELGFSIDRAAVERRLESAIPGYDGQPRRVRLLVAADGEMTLTHQPVALPPEMPTLRFAWAGRAVESSDPLLRHKTTQRNVYETELARQRAATGCDEILFVNERGELTEGSWTTLFARIAGRLRTPPVACGLLPGVLRAALLADRAQGVVEQILTPDDVAAAERVFLGNSVRGLMPAEPIARRLLDGR